MATKRRVLKISLLILLALIVIILVFLPALVKGYAIKHSKELVGRQIDIEKLRFNYFTSSIKVYGFKMFEPNEKDIFTSFDTLIINAEPYKLISNTKSIEQFYLEGLKVNIIKRDSTYNFDDLIAFFKEQDSVPSDSLNENAFKYTLSNLELKHASFSIHEADIDNTTHIDDFSFFIPFIGWNQDDKSTADIKFNFKRGGYFESSFNINPVDGEYDATLTIKDLYLDPFYKNASQYAYINSLEGKVDSKLKIVGNINNPDSSLVSGDITLFDFLMTDSNNEKILASKQVTCNLQELDVSKDSYKIESLTVDEPYIKFQLDSISNNLFRTFKYNPDEESSETESDSTSTNIYYAINRMKVNKGVLDYTDNLTGQPFNYHLSEIAVDTDSIFSYSKWVDVNSEMLLNDRGTLNAEVGFNPSNPMYADLDIKVENFLLSDLNIYSNYYTGHSILQGDMFYYSFSKITNGDIISENHLIIKDVSVNNDKNGLVTIPLKFAIFLLKDKNGNIDLDVPVRGDLNNPEVDVWKIVWTTIKKLIFNTTENPVKSLAKLVDADPKDLESIAFVYPDTVPGEEQKRQLDLILSIENQKPGLRIDMQYAVDSLLLRQQILNQKIADLYYQKSGKSLVDEKDLKEFVYSEIGSDSLKIEDAKVTLIGRKVLDSLSISFSRSLKSGVKNYILNMSAGSNINISDSKESSEKVENPTFKMKYSLKEDDLDEN